MKNLFLVFALVCANTLFAKVTPYEWEKDRAPYKLTPAERAMKELVLKLHHQYDYDLEGDDFVMYYTYHKITFVNNEEAVQKHNRISIALYNDELVDLKARAFTKSGKVVNFNKSDLKEIKEEKTGDAYRIFAIEGIEIGSEVEFYFTKKMNGAIYERVNVQTDAPIKQASFQLMCPRHLKFDFKSYNSLADVVREESSDEKQPTNRYHLEVKDVPAMKEENYSYYQANLRKIEYKLAYNVARSNARMYTWEDAAKTFYKKLYTLEKEEEKALDKFVKSLKDNSATKLDERIASIEEKIKKEIKVDDNHSSKELTSIASIQKYKIASREGITRLFIALYGKVGISCKPLITCDRRKVKFDGKFDSWAYLDDYAIYFPDAKGFIAPYQFETRYPFIPAGWTAQDALFIDPITVGDLKSALASVEEVPPTDFSLSKDDLQIDVKLNDDLQSASVKIVRTFSGYNAEFIAPYYDFMNEEQRKQMVSELIKQFAPDAQIKSSTTQKTNNKLTIDTDFQSAHFFEKAGPKVLFKLGLLIGPQVEMYRDDKRMNSVENDHNHGYDRTIRVTLPQGYVVKNMDDLKLNVLYKDGTEIPFSFVSNGAMNGNVLEVKADEYYKRVYAPLNRYEDFRKVVNAAADFNKITLVLEKK